MPALQLWGRVWHIAPDVLPLPAAFGLAFNLFWVLYLLLGTAIEDKWPHSCSGGGVHYVVLISLYFALYVAGSILDALIIAIGMRGTPLQASKRRALGPVISINVGFCWTTHAATTVYGTVVVHSQSATCWAAESSESVEEVSRALVYSAWGSILITALCVFLVYNPFVESDDSRKIWVRRCKLVGRLCGCYTEMTTKLQGRERKPIHNIADWMSGLTSHADLEASDVTAGLILTAAAQKLRRSFRIGKAIVACSSSELPLRDGPTSTEQDVVIQVDAHPQPTSGTTSSRSTTQQQMGDSTGNIVPQQQRRRGYQPPQPSHISPTVLLHDAPALPVPSSSSSSMTDIEEESIDDEPYSNDESGQTTDSDTEEEPEQEARRKLRDRMYNRWTTMRQHRRHEAGNNGSRITPQNVPVEHDDVDLESGVLGLEGSGGRATDSEIVEATERKVAPERDVEFRSCPEAPGADSLDAEKVDVLGVVAQGGNISPGLAARGARGVASFGSDGTLTRLPSSPQSMPSAFGAVSGTMQPTSSPVGSPADSELTGRESGATLMGIDTLEHSMDVELAPDGELQIWMKPSAASSTRGSTAGSRTSLTTATSGADTPRSPLTPADIPASSISCPAVDGGYDTDAAVGGAVPQTVRSGGPSTAAGGPSRRMRDSGRGGALGEIMEEEELAGVSSGVGVEVEGGGAARGGLKGGDLSRSMTALYPTVLTPSGQHNEIGVPLLPKKAADLYTGPHAQVSREDLSDLLHFLKYAVAVYAIDPAAEAKNKSEGCCCSCCDGVLCGLCLEAGEQEAVDQNPFISQRKAVADAMRQFADIAAEDILHWSTSNTALAHLPYMMLLDRQTKSVVVAIRGTLSGADLVTDAVIHPQALDQWIPAHMRKHIRGRSFGHGGMINAVRSILKDLDDHGILEPLLQGANTAPSPPTAESMSRDEAAVNTKANVPLTGEPTLSPHPTSGAPALEAGGHVAAGGTDAGGTLVQPNKDKGAWIAAEMKEAIQEGGWKLVLCGHSLGAGASALLALALKGRYPDLRCICYSPPGGLLSHSLANALGSFCMSVVVGKDVVPRMNVNTLRRLMDEMVTALARCKRHKLTVLSYGWSPAWRRSSITNLFYHYRDIPPECRSVLQSYFESIQKQGKALNMYPPGRVAFLRPIKTERSKAWDAVWVTPKELISEGILVSSRMYSDHLCGTVERALKLAGATKQEKRTADSNGSDQ